MTNDNFDCLKLQNQLCFPLYACSKEIIRLYTPYLREIGLTYTQYITMMVMWEQKVRNVSEIGERLYLDSGTLTPLLKKLEEKGLVTRKRDFIDERNLVVSITEKGEALREQAAEIPAKVGACLKLNEDESKALYDTLYKLLDTVKEIK